MKVAQIFIASDHAGFNTKEFVKSYLSNFEFDVVDLGAYSKDMSVDYPDFADKMAENINNDFKFGILICGTGIGISIAANRHPHIRCALCHDATTAKLAREHNDANVLCFGGRIVGTSIIQDMVKVFFTTEFAGGRHEKRVYKLGNYKC
ncbi:ribose 5-phosphate isomerase B [Campylobacter fetus]|nr:ribose 5-phosphate isomerase B [Campylobacter fetus]EJU9539635.1 ribose 5-phosphate isomerase B [Campylobacter fetus]